MAVGRYDIYFILRMRDEMTRTMQGAARNMSGFHKQIADSQANYNNKIQQAQQSIKNVQQAHSNYTTHANQQVRSQIAPLQARNAEIRAQIAHHKSVAANYHGAVKQQAQSWLQHTAPVLRKEASLNQQSILQHQQEAKAAVDKHQRTAAAAQRQHQQTIQQKTAERDRQLALANEHSAQMNMLMNTSMWMTRLGTTLTIVGSLWTAFFVQSTRGMAEFNKEIAWASTQVDDLRISIEHMTAVAHRTARDVPVDLAALPAVMFDVMSTLHPTYKEFEGVVNGLSRASVAGQADIQTTSRATMNIMNAFKVPLRDIDRILDMQFRTVQRGTGTYEELAGSVGRAIPPFAAFDQRIETMLGSWAMLTRMGLSAEMAMTASARAMELFARPQSVAALEGMGVQVRENNGEFRQLNEILTDLGKNHGWEKMTGPELGEAMQSLWGQRAGTIQARRFFTLVIQNLDQFNRIIDDIAGSEGDMNRAYQTILVTPQAQAELLANRMAVLRQEIGESLLGAFSGLIRMGNRAIEMWSGLDQSTQRSMTQFAALTGVIVAITGALLTFGGMATYIMAAIGNAIGLNLRQMITMFGKWGLAIAAAQAVLFVLIANMDTYRISAEAMGRHTRALLGLFSGFGDRIREASAAKAEYREKMLIVAAALVLLTGTMVAFTVVAGGATVSISALVAAKGALAAASVPVAAGLAKVRAALIALVTWHPVLLAITAAFLTITAVLRMATSQTRANIAASEDHVRALNEEEAAATALADGLNGSKERLQDMQREQVVTAVTSDRMMRAMMNLGFSAEEVTNAVMNGGPALDRMKRAAYGAGFGFHQSARDARHFMTEIEAQRHAVENSVDTYLAFEKAMGGQRRTMALLIEQYGDLEGGVESLDRSAQRHVRRLLSATGSTENWAEMLAELSEQGHDVTPMLDMLGMEMSDLEEDTIELTEAGEALKGMFTDMLSVSTAFNNAIKSVSDSLNEAAKEAEQDAPEFYNHLELAMTNGMALQDEWVANIQQAEQDYDRTIGNIITIVRRNAEATGESSSDVITALAEMGEAGPAAMEILASADAEPFLEILNGIRREALLTKDEVIQNMDMTIQGIEAVLTQNADVPEQLLGDMFDAMIQHSYDMKGHVQLNMIGTMQNLERITRDGTPPTLREIQTFYAGMEEFSRNGSVATTNVYDAMWAKQLRLTRSGSEDIKGELEAFASVISKLMKAGADDATAAFIASFSGGVTDIGIIMDAYNRAIAQGLNPILASLGAARLPSVVTRANRHITGLRTQRNKGGWINGPNVDRDIIPALLTPGEFVLRRDVAQRLDPQSLHELNRTGNPEALLRNDFSMFHSGGWVRASDVPGTPSYAPYGDPTVAGARGSSNKLYREVKDWMNRMLPPLSGGIGWQAMWNAIQVAFPGTALHSAYRPGAITATGNPSYHGMGRAIDISPNGTVANWIRRNYMAQTRELIFSPMGSSQVRNGRNHYYSGITRDMHWDHIHWAMANGGQVLRNKTRVLVGENGPEILNLNKGDRVAPLDGAGGKEYNYMPNATVYVQDATDLEVHGKRMEQWVRSREP